MHKLIRLVILCFTFLLIFNEIEAQNIPIGTWRDHLPYRDAVSVDEGNDVIYCASNSALFSYDLNDGSIDRLTVVNGLSDIGISKIKYSKYSNKLVIAYNNGNIDIIDENKSITNLSFVKNSSIIGDKSINNIFIQNNLAYLSTGFGIVVLDIDKLEIQDTYLIGNLGSYIKVNSVTMDSLNIYAATESGVYYADKNDPNLVDYNVWNTVNDLGNNTFSEIVYFQKKLFTIKDRGVQPDSILYGDAGNWQAFTSQSGFTTNLCLLNGESMAIIWTWGISFYDNSLSKYSEIYEFSPREIIRDSKFLEYWMAEYNEGLIHISNLGTLSTESIIPNSPSTSSMFDLDFHDGELWTVSGGYSVGNLEYLFNHKKEGSWNTFPKYTENVADTGYMYDFVSVKINPNNPSNVYMGSWLNGLVEINNNTVTNVYNGHNSLLDTIFFSTATAVKAMDFDRDNNLWITSSYSKINPLAVKTADNNWYNYSFPGYTSQLAFYPDMIIDDNNYIWLISPDENKILVFDHNNTIDNKNDDRIVVNTNYPGTRIESFAIDKDGEIWLGTDEGVGVFYNPSQVFDEDIEGQQIYIQQEGQTQILLETEKVSAIAVDGANRKWFGTQSSGVYLMSSDGTEEIEHFTSSNSPLLSNNIFDIEIDNETGEVYFATAKGLISYKGTATEPLSDFDIFVYPNPVKPNYDGVIAIRGLVKDTDVRITDISGNIVYETTSLGGQAIWDGNDFHGNRVQSGVYMVFNGSQDGNLKAAAKILFLN